MTQRFHLFPFRTQKLSSVVPKIVGWRRPAKIGRCRLSLFIWGKRGAAGPGKEPPRPQQSLRCSVFCPPGLLNSLGGEVTAMSWPVGQAVKTAASHAANGSSILPRVTINKQAFLLFYAPPLN